ncbi:hypothetical protein [Variovorax sp. YR634]|uniref:RipA family octameric membrane protein n=1 Tax=Variovorax sp. YR634 TaxID=1884385 RepID=UPI00115F8225|nr:hypothetical protein [Variovorax sp. YR634]
MVVSAVHYSGDPPQEGFKRAGDAMGWFLGIVKQKFQEQLPPVVDDTASGIKRVYELALKQREFEIAQLTQRNNFFMIFQGVLIGGLVQSQGTAAPLINFLLCITGMAISIFQIGMAGGAKYWQTRWEVAVKNIELYLLESMKDNPHQVIQLFTVDGKHLGPEEKRRIAEINKSPARINDQLASKDGYIDKIVGDDIDRSEYMWFNRGMISWAVKKKWSVSKIPLWVGFFLFVFWLLLWMNTFSIVGETLLSRLFIWFPSGIFELKSFK